MTTDVAQVADTAALDDMLSSLEAIARGQRDPSILEGTKLGTTDIEGAPATFFKQKSMVNYNGRPLPERVQYWHRGTNRYVMLATAMLPQLLAETLGDGTPTFTRTMPADYVAPLVDENLQCPILQNGNRTCLGNGNGNGFYSEDAFEKHMRTLHTEEYEAILRKEERAERRQELAQQRQLAEAIVGLASGGSQQKSAPQPAAQGVTFACRAEGCARFFDTDAGRTLHEKKGHKA